MIRAYTTCNLFCVTLVAHIIFSYYTYTPIIRIIDAAERLYRSERFIYGANIVLS